MGFSMIKHRILELNEAGCRYFCPQYRVLFFWCYYYDISDDKYFFPSKTAALEFIARKNTKKTKIIHKL